MYTQVFPTAVSFSRPMKKNFRAGVLDMIILRSDETVPKRAFAKQRCRGLKAHGCSFMISSTSSRQLKSASQNGMNHALDSQC